MAAKQEEAPAVGLDPPPERGATAPALSVPDLPTPLQHQSAPVASSHGVYPKPQATHEQVFNNERKFMETFYSLHTALKSKPTIPTVGGKDLDVHLLFKEVSSRGGFLAVANSRKWKEVSLVFDYPATTTSASSMLRNHYITLLYHYEQVYKHGATGPLLILPALTEGAETAVRKRVRKRRVAQPQLPTVDPAAAIGSTISGSIEGKIDVGYLVTMVVGGEQLKGVLYHVPPGNNGPQFATLPGLLNNVSTDLGGGEIIQTRRKRRRKDEMPKKDPNAPRPNRTGYNFFFAEQRQRLKLLHPDKDREISRMIGEAWNALSEQDKMPYQDRGLKDKERFKREYRDYREKQRVGFYDNPTNGQAPPTVEAVVPPEDRIADQAVEPNHTTAMEIETLPPSGSFPVSEPMQISQTDPSGVSGQLEQKPAMPPTLLETQIG